MEKSDHQKIDRRRLVSTQLIQLSLIYSFMLPLLFGCEGEDGKSSTVLTLRAGTEELGGNEEAMSPAAEEVINGGGEETNEQTNPDGYLERLTLDDEARGPSFAKIEDLNGDGKLDLIISKFGPVGGFNIEPGQITIYYQGDSLNDWTLEEVTSDDEPLYWPNSVETVDIDGDGDLDLTVGAGFLICEILGRTDSNGGMTPPSPCGGLLWYERTDEGWTRHDVVSQQSELFYHHGLIADLDGDGINDLFTVGERRYFEGGSLVDIAEAQWFKGTIMGARFESTPRVIGPGMGSLAELHDLDGDGDLDVISAELFAGFDAQSFAWYEQIQSPTADLPAGDWERHVIDDQVGPAIQLSLVEGLFAEGERVLIGANHTQATGDDPDPWASAVYVYEPTSDLRAPWVGTRISRNIASLPRDNQAAPGIFGTGDINGDDRMDVLVSGDGDSRVFALIQNDTRRFETWVLDDELPQASAMKVRDLNGDGRAELLVTSYDKDVIYLYRAAEGGEYPLRLAERPEWANETQLEGGSEVEVMGGESVGGAEEVITGGEETSLAGDVIEISYTGSQTGPLVIAAFTSWPPAGPPSAFEQIPSPTFPERVTLPDLAAGTYTLLTFIDVDGSGPMAPSQADVQSRIEVTFPFATPIEINLDGESTEGLEIVEHLLTREGRSIPIVAYLPETSSALPLIVFTPGFQVASSSYTPMLERLANEGYNVVRADPPGTPFDVNHIEMATDIRAVIDWLLSADFASSIDGSKIATMGHSLGGKIALFNAARDSRVVATFAIDPVDGDPSPIPDPMARPTLAPDVISEITGAVGLVGELTNGESSNPFAPACAPLANNFQTIFEALVNASWVVEWELIGADHMDFVNECPQGLFSPCSLCAEGTMNPDQVRELTTQFASDFFGLHLRDETHREVNLTMSSSADVRVRTR